MALQTGDASAAAGHLGQATGADPEYPDAWAELGNAYLRLKNFEAAREALDRAVKLDPESIGANIQLLRLYRLTNDPRTKEQQQRFERLNAERSRPESWMLRRVVLKPY
jgi:Tfp pilus assembly protein PilF